MEENGFGSDGAFGSVDQVKDLVLDVLVKRSCIAKESIKDSCDLCEDLSMDSLDKVETVMDIEKSLGIAISDAELEKAETVADLVELSTRKFRDKAAVN